MDNTVLYDLSYGMYAVGVKDGMRECGCIVNTVFQVSTIGPLIALSMNNDNYTCSLIEKSKCFSLSILPETIDSQVISDLGFQTGKDKDKWVKLNHHLFRELPVVDDALGYMMCEVQSQMDAGTHFVFLAKVVDAKKGDSGKPMTYAYYHNVLKQSAPAKAPTYRKEEKWVCSVCDMYMMGMILKVNQMIMYVQFVELKKTCLNCSKKGGPINGSPLALIEYMFSLLNIK